MLRELELGCAQVKHLTIDRDALTVEWNLPASKTDVKALGKRRSWGCVCGGSPELPCPVHAVLGQMQLLIDAFGQVRVDAGELPLFPTRAGGFTEKRHVVMCIEAVVSLVGEPLVDPNGVRRHGGHTLRITGARTMAALGIEIYLIQLMARWASDVVYRYVAEAPLSRMTAAYRSGFAARAGVAVREVSTLQRASEDPMPSNAGIGSVHPGPWVLNLDSGITHRPTVWTLDVQPPQWRTACGWACGMANTTGVSQLPSSSSRLCSGCFRGAKAAARAREQDSLSTSSSSSSSCAPS